MNCVAELSLIKRVAFISHELFNLETDSGPSMFFFVVICYRDRYEMPEIPGPQTPRWVTKLPIRVDLVVHAWDAQKRCNTCVVHTHIHTHTHRKRRLPKIVKEKKKNMSEFQEVAGGR